MGTAILVAVVLLMGLAGPARADAPASALDSSLADQRLSDPETFAEFADASRPRPAGVFVPARRNPMEGQGRRRAAGLTPMAVLPRPALAAIPSPKPLPSRSSLKSRGHSLPSPLGAAALTLAALFLAGRQDRRYFPLPGGSPSSVAYPEGIPLTPLPPRRRPPPPLWTAAASPRPEPIPLPAAPELRLPWWAITAAEQEAINRWDASPEKEFEYTPLNSWLDAHQGEFKGVNVRRLKEKLWRDA